MLNMNNKFDDEFRLYANKKTIFQQKKYGKTVYYTLLNWVQMSLDRGDIKKNIWERM